MEAVQRCLTNGEKYWTKQSYENAQIRWKLGKSEEFIVWTTPKKSIRGLFRSNDEVARSSLFRSSELWSLNWFVYCNNVPGHRMLSVKQLISKTIYYWKGTSPYSPDFSPIDIGTHWVPSITNLDLEGTKVSGYRWYYEKEIAVVKFASKDEFHTWLWQWKNCCAVSWHL